LPYVCAWAFRSVRALPGALTLSLQPSIALCDFHLEMLGSFFFLQRLGKTPFLAHRLWQSTLRLLSSANAALQQSLTIFQGNTMRTAVVTGGIGGLGTAICKLLAQNGRKVIAADLAARAERVEEFKAEVASFGGQIVFEPINVGDFAACAEFAERVKASHGEVDIVVNSAGITRDTTFRKMTPTQWMDVMHINLDGAFNVTRQFIDGMCERGFGRIVNISSVNGQTGQFGQTNYSASKAGIHGFTMALAKEVARKGVTVNSISPGYCRTAMVMAIPEAVREQIIAQIPVGRIGEPSEIARAVEFLVADDAGFVTGANLPVNGGYFISF
jgi:acetoacetyl-CoA reductase